MAARQRRFEITVFLLLDGPPSMLTSPTYPELLAFKTPDSPVPLLLSVYAGTPGLESHASRPGVGLNYQRLYETHAMEELNRLWELISTQPLRAQ